MAYAFQDARGWVADYRPYNWTRPEGFKGRPRQRIGRGRWEKAGDPKAACDAYAQACDRACRMLEQGNVIARDVNAALLLGAITDAQASALLDGGVAEAGERKGAPTIEQAALAHPSSRRQSLTDRRNYLGWLGEFQTWAGITHLHQLTLDHVQRFIAYREAEGDTWEMRRHRLIYLRRAARMAAAVHGLPDVLSDFRLDRREAKASIATNSLDELALALTRLELRRKSAEDADERRRWTRAMCAIALGGLVGLRPSETFAVDDGDVTDGALATGKKTPASRRRVPLPATVAKWLGELAKGRDGAVFLNDRGRPYTMCTWSLWLCPVLEELTGRKLQAKSLRKSFATWATRSGLPINHVEAFLGHASAFTAAVTNRHYLGDWLVGELQPTAEAIDRRLAKAMQDAKVKAAKAEAAWAKEQAAKRASWNLQLSRARKARATPSATSLHKS